MDEDSVWVNFEIIEKFMVDVFKGLRVAEEDAKVCADVQMKNSLSKCFEG